MWTSVLNFHTLRATGNSIRQTEQKTLLPLESCQLGLVCIHALFHEFGERAEKNGSRAFQPNSPRKQTQEVTQELKLLYVCLSTISQEVIDWVKQAIDQIWDYFCLTQSNHVAADFTHKSLFTGVEWESTGYYSICERKSLLWLQNELQGMSVETENWKWKKSGMWSLKDMILPSPLEASGLRLH